MNDIERLLECLTCKREPLTCGCTEKDESEDGSCVKYKGGDDNEID